jgi:uncharacterized protein (TIGR02996 family)
MTPHFAGFVRAIHENPKDELNYLALSDHLEEEGHPHEAALLRFVVQHGGAREAKALELYRQGFHVHRNTFIGGRHSDGSPVGLLHESGIVLSNGYDGGAKIPLRDPTFKLIREYRRARPKTDMPVTLAQARKLGQEEAWHAAHNALSQIAYHHVNFGDPDVGGRLTKHLQKRGQFAPSIVSMDNGRVSGRPLRNDYEYLFPPRIVSIRRARRKVESKGHPSPSAPVRLAREQPRPSSDVDGLVRAVHENPRDGTLWGALSDAMEEAGHVKLPKAIRTLLHLKQHEFAMLGTKTGDSPSEHPHNVFESGVLLRHPDNDTYVRLPYEGRNVEHALAHEFKALTGTHWMARFREEHRKPEAYDRKREIVEQLGHLLSTFSTPGSDRHHGGLRLLSIVNRGGRVTAWRNGNDRWREGSPTWQPPHRTHRGDLVRGRQILPFRPSLYSKKAPVQIEAVRSKPGSPLKLAREGTTIVCLNGVPRGRVTVQGGVPWVEPSLLHLFAAAGAPVPLLSPGPLSPVLIPGVGILTFMRL